MSQAMFYRPAADTNRSAAPRSNNNNSNMTPASALMEQQRQQHQQQQFYRGNVQNQDGPIRFLTPGVPHTIQQQQQQQQQPPGSASSRQYLSVSEFLKSRRGPAPALRPSHHSFDQEEKSSRHSPRSANDYQYYAANEQQKRLLNQQHEQQFYQQHGYNRSQRPDEIGGMMGVYNSNNGYYPNTQTAAGNQQQESVNQLMSSVPHNETQQGQEQPTIMVVDEDTFQSKIQPYLPASGPGAPTVAYHPDVANTNGYSNPNSMQYKIGAGDEGQSQHYDRVMKLIMDSVQSGNTGNPAFARGDHSGAPMIVPGTNDRVMRLIMDSMKSDNPAPFGSMPGVLAVSEDPNAPLIVPVQLPPTTAQGPRTEAGYVRDHPSSPNEAEQGDTEEQPSTGKMTKTEDQQETNSDPSVSSPNGVMQTMEVSQNSESNPPKSDQDCPVYSTTASEKPVAERDEEMNPSGEEKKEDTVKTETLGDHPDSAPAQEDLCKSDNEFPTSSATAPGENKGDDSDEYAASLLLFLEKHAPSVESVAAIRPEDKAQEPSSDIKSAACLLVSNSIQHAEDEDNAEGKKRKKKRSKKDVATEPKKKKKRRNRSPKPETKRPELPDLRDELPPWEKLICKHNKVARLEDRDILFLPDDEDSDSENPSNNRLTPAIQAHARASIDPSFDSLFVAMAQMVPCGLNLIDQTSAITSYKQHKLGFPGLCCRHCGGRPGSGRYFPNSVRSLSQTTTAHNMIKHFMNASNIVPDDEFFKIDEEKSSVEEDEKPHEAFGENESVSSSHGGDHNDTKPDKKDGKKLPKNLGCGKHCTKCPYSVWLWLTEFQRRLGEGKDSKKTPAAKEDDSKVQRVKYGARKIFYGRVWRRMNKEIPFDREHDEDDEELSKADSETESQASGTEDASESETEKKSQSKKRKKKPSHESSNKGVKAKKPKKCKEERKVVLDLTTKVDTPQEEKTAPRIQLDTYLKKSEPKAAELQADSENSGRRSSRRRTRSVGEYYIS